MKNIDTTTIGGRIKELRIKKGLSQEELAEVLLINAKNVSAYENNRNDIPGSMAVALAKALDSTTDYILAGVAEGNKWENELLSYVRKITDEKMRALIMAQVKCAVDLG